MGKMTEGNTVFQAELMAINKALEWTVQYRSHDQVHLYSDSMSVLEALTDPTNRDPTIIKTKSLYHKSLSDNKVTKLHWVKAHVGIEGNERADEAAKEATRQNIYHWEILKSISRVKYVLKAHSLFEWQVRWTESEKGRITNEYFPRISLKRLVQGRVAHLATGHGRFMAHFNRINLFGDGKCTCGAIGSGSHYIETCPKTKLWRDKMRYNEGDRSTIFNEVNEYPLFKIALIASEMIPDNLIRT